MFEIINDDILKSGADIIVHQVNCKGVMGAGLARQIKIQNPLLYEAYRTACLEANTAQLLGTALIIPIDKDRYRHNWDQQCIANCFAQDGYGRNKVQTNYEALRSALAQVREYALSIKRDATIAIPYKIGCGLAGGNWEIVFDIIKEVFSDCEHTNVTIWRHMA